MTSPASHANPSIADLPRIVDALPPADAQRLQRIYDIIESTGRMRIPNSMAPWVERTFGPVRAVENQRVIRVANLVTGESAIFNELRARRPLNAQHSPHNDNLDDNLANDPWTRPRESTPEDTFGRLETPIASTASNIAKYDALHSLIIFAEPNPLLFNRDAVRGCIRLANQWFDAAHASDPEALYPFFLWNCLWRSGSSIVHGHAQTQLARRRHYARIEALRAAAANYRAIHRHNYFHDLAETHESLGLSAPSSNDIRVLASLTPIKEKETIILAPEFNDNLADALHAVLAAFRDNLGVRSFNVGALLPPLNAPLSPPSSHPNPPPENDWQDFPVVVRIVDRGNLDARTSDIGAMELFAEPVVASDPFAIAATLSTALQPQGSNL